MIEVREISVTAGKEHPLAGCERIFRRRERILDGIGLPGLTDKIRQTVTNRWSAIMVYMIHKAQSSCFVFCM